MTATKALIAATTSARSGCFLQIKSPYDVAVGRWKRHSYATKSPDRQNSRWYDSSSISSYSHLFFYRDLFLLFTDRVYGDPRIFPRHEEVLEFVKDFATEFGLTELIRFETEVVRVERVESADDGWIVESRTSGASGEEEFEAVPDKIWTTCS